MCFRVPVLCIIGSPLAVPGDVALMSSHRLLPLLLTLLLTACAGMELPRDLPLGGPGDGDDDRGAEAIREALRVGTERTVDRTSRTDGYFGNALIRIGLPEEFRGASERLRSIGLGAQVDDLERRMNRAAEAAAAEAAPVFTDAIRGMRPADVHQVLRGEEDAATRYLRNHSEETLRRRYEPVVREQMTAAGVYRVYQPLRDSYNRIPGLPELELDLDRYVTERALEGLFTILAREEGRIREDPAARTTELLREYFGQ